MAVKRSRGKSVPSPAGPQGVDQIDRLILKTLEDVKKNLARKLRSGNHFELLASVFVCSTSS
jgi:hypothetical protein